MCLLQFGASKVKLFFMHFHNLSLCLVCPWILISVCKVQTRKLIFPGSKKALLWIFLTVSIVTAWLLVQNVVIELRCVCTTVLYGNRDNRDGRAELLLRRLFQTLRSTVGTQEWCSIKNTGEGTDHLEKTGATLDSTYLSPLGLHLGCKTPQHCPMTLPLPSRVLCHQGGHPALAQPPGSAIPQLHLLHSPLAVPDKGRWLIKVTGLQSREELVLAQACLLQ